MNVLAYEQTPSGKLSIANHAAEAVKAAAIAVPETQLSITRSMNVIIVQEKLDTTRGAETRRTSRPPAGRDHQESSGERIDSTGIRGASRSMVRKPATSFR